jgi:hypothetical protein
MIAARKKWVYKKIQVSSFSINKKMQILSFNLVTLSL